MQSDPGAALVRVPPPRRITPHNPPSLLPPALTAPQTPVCGVTEKPAVLMDFGPDSGANSSSDLYTVYRGHWFVGRIENVRSMLSTHPSIAHSPLSSAPAANRNTTDGEGRVHTTLIFRMKKAYITCDCILMCIAQKRWPECIVVERVPIIIAFRNFRVSISFLRELFCCHHIKHQLSGTPAERLFAFLCEKFVLYELKLNMWQCATH